MSELVALLRRAKQTLCVPAAEYVPAMGDAMILLDKAIQVACQTDPKWGESLLKPVSVAPSAPREIPPLIPVWRFPDGTSRRLTEAEWQEAKRAWGRPVEPLTEEE